MVTTARNPPRGELSTAAEIAEIRAAGDIGSAEVCPHHLFFNVDDYDRLGSLVKMNPSIKTQADNAALWQALIHGDIEVIATDHAPHTLEEKRQPFPRCPSGLPAVENSLALLLNQANQKNCTLPQIVKWMCHNPARIWNIKNKGKIEIGFDADLVLVDMELEQQIKNEQQLTKCKWSPWNGETLMGWPVSTWVMGKLAFRHQSIGSFQCEQPIGTEIEYQSLTD